MQCIQLHRQALQTESSPLDWLALMLVEIRSTKTLVTIYVSTWRNIPQDLNLRHYHYEKIKSGSKIVKPSYSFMYSGPYQMYLQYL